jgi:microcompartment protein CcmK/EutM
MHLCRVTGTVVAPHKHQRLDGHRLLLVERIGTDGRALGRPEEIALDPGLDAGIGDVVLTVKEGAVVADLFDHAGRDEPTATPANVAIVCVVDSWSVTERDAAC